MYRPHPFQLTTLHAWIAEARSVLGQDATASQVMKHIHVVQPGVLFSPHWFAAMYKKYVNCVANG
jgi:hypothetical protein